MRGFVLFLCFFTPFQTAYAKKETQLRSLHDFSSLPSDQLVKKFDLAVVYTVGCQSCSSQMKELSCLKGKRRIVLLGLGINERQLRQTYKKYRVSFPSYQINSGSLVNIGGEADLSPQVISIKSKKRLVGKQSCQTLKSFE